METHNPTLDKNDRVIIRDLTLEMSAGIYTHEKQAKQRVIVNILLDVESNYGRALNSINNVVSYEHIVNAVTEVSEIKHYDLLEEFAEDAAVVCLENPLVLCAQITVEKPDIIESTKSVGVEIMRRK